MHQIENDKIKQFILYIFRNLFDVEFRYWTTKLKVDALMWILIKLSQYFDDDKFIIIIDYIALKSTLQTKIKNQRFVRLNKWFMFLSKYMSRMNIVYKSNTSHQNVDELFKLTTYNTKIYLIVILIANNDFHQKFRQVLFSNFRFDKIYVKIQNQI